MKTQFTIRPLFTSLVLLLATSLNSQTVIDAEFAAEIAKIKAIDHHAHPLRVVAAGEKADDEYDALPLDSIEPFPLPVRLRPDNPEYTGAWQALYGYAHKDMSEAHVRELTALKQRVMREKGDAFPAWVLDQLAIETMFANRIAMGRGLAAPRFQWVSFVDPFLFPLDNGAAKKSNPDARSLYSAEERLLKRYVTEAGLSALPQSLEDYLAKVVTATLERQKRGGAVAVKFEVAYLRPVDFAEASEAEARRVYAQFVKGGEPAAAEYKTLQDFLFRYLAREAGRLGLTVHIHVVNGAGSYYNQRGSDPLLLEPTFNDPTLRKTSFVLIHGGYPFTRQAAGLLGKPNVYADFSGQTFLLYPRALSEVLRDWLEFFPEKILFATDAFIMTPQVDWPELGWLSNATARKALALALTSMMNDGEISRERALELARMVLRENAIKLYRLK